MGKILWLASYPKSGNTWLRAFLHNLLRNPAEPFDINALDRFSTMDSAVRHFQALGTQNADFARKPPEAWSKKLVAAARPATHKGMTGLFPDVVMVKTHNAILVDRGTPTISMEHTAAAIYMVRNPLDIAISYAHHNNMTINRVIDRLADDQTQTSNSKTHVYECRASWSGHVRSWTARAHPGLHIIRYEDALEDPMSTFGSVARFLGTNPPAQRLEKAIQFSSFKTLRKQEEKAGFSERAKKQRRFFRKGKSGQWRDVLSKSQIERICERHADQMARFDYLPSEI